MKEPCFDGFAMEESEADKLRGISDGDGEDSGSTIFPELKNLCLELLELLHNPQKNYFNSSSSFSALSQLLELLRRSPPSSLQPFFEYCLFLLVLGGISMQKTIY